MKRIGLFLGVEPTAGGMFQYAETLLDALTSLPIDDYAIEVACASRPWEPILKRYQVSVTWLTGGTFGLQFARAIMAARLPGSIARALSAVCNPIAASLRRIGCDLWIFPAQDAIAYQLPLPVVVSIHDLMHRYQRKFPEIGGGQRFHIREHRFRSLAHWAEGILVDSEVGKSHVVEAYGIDPQKVYPLPYIPPRYILEPCEEEDGFDLKYNLPAKFIFYPAQFWPHKNHRTLVSAAASVLPMCPDMRLVFTGGSDQKSEPIREHARALGLLENVRFLGYVPNTDLAGIYRRARAMVMPTFIGPTNIPPLEAFACGCPVAVSGIYAMPEQLGDAALYFDPCSVTEVATATARLWLDDALCEDLREKGRAKLASWGRLEFNTRLKEILSHILRKGDGPREFEETGADRGKVIPAPCYS